VDRCDAVTHAWLIKSTGNAMLDRAAVDSGPTGEKKKGTAVAMPVF
jgi:hypothetical protein